MRTARTWPPADPAGRPRLLLIGLGVDGTLCVVAEWRWDSRQQGRQMLDVEYSPGRARGMARLGRAASLTGHAWLVLTAS